MRSAALLLLALAILPGCDGPEQPATPSNEERIAALGLHRDPLPDADNPILSLKEPLETFLKETRDDFQTDADLPTFLNFQVGPETLKRCWALQQVFRETIDRGPGRIPDPDLDGFNVFLIIQAQRANAALAAKSLADDNPAGAAFHLAFTLEIADYMIAGEPPLLAYSFAVLLKREAFTDLLLLYKAAPTPALLAQIATICDNARFKKSGLTSTLRSQARIGIEIYQRFPEWIREQHKEYGSLFLSFNGPPLADCTLEQLLALPYDPEASVSLSLDEIEESLRWLEEDAPLTQGPPTLLNPKSPKSLDYYKSAPNGLTEIFSDCNPAGPHLTALVIHQILDAHIDTALAWLRAEADGIAVNSLDALVPEYLDRVPTDPCDGKPLRCIPEKRLIYSIGIDLKDDEGLSGLDPDQEDPTAMDRVLIIPEITR